MIDSPTLDAFRNMWGLFPEPVMLIQKDRTIVAVNQLAQQLGIAAGIRCFTLNPAETDTNACRHCKANLALSTHKAVAGTSPEGIAGYWIPVENRDDLYVHFGIGTARLLADHQAPAQPELINLQ